jgi:hypothetical protein
MYVYVLIWGFVSWGKGGDWRHMGMLCMRDDDGGMRDDDEG